MSVIADRYVWLYVFLFLFFEIFLNKPAQVNSCKLQQGQEDAVIVRRLYFNLFKPIAKPIAVFEYCFNRDKLNL